MMPQIYLDHINVKNLSIQGLVIVNIAPSLYQQLDVFSFHILFLPCISPWFGTLEEVKKHHFDKIIRVGSF